MTRYRIDSRRVSLKEFRTDASLPMALVGWLVTRFPNRLPSSSEYPGVDHLQRYLISGSQVPSEFLEAIQEPTDELIARGFRGRVFHAIDEPEQQTTHHYASFLHASGATVACVKRREFHGVTPHKVFLITDFISGTEDGTFLVTSNSRGDLATPEACQIVCMPGASIDEVWKEHQGRIGEARWRGKLRTVGNAQGVVANLDDLQDCICRHLVARGVFVPVAELPGVLAGEPFESADAEPLVGEMSQLVHEVRRQESKKSGSSIAALLLLLVTGGLFVALGGLAWSWTFALLLVPILLFHELGHYACMKMFDYRNVKMFFIPLFGAAVSGRNYNVAGWKRVVTSLMGPVPGIAVGIGLGIVGLVRGYEILVQGGLMMLVLNGFNLIPALPLDGGWVVHALIFSRHAFLDLIFRAAAIGLLLFVGAVGGGWLLFGVGIAMLIGLPAAFRVARITDRLRGQHALPAATDDGQMPPSAVVRIAAELDGSYPKGLALRNKAAMISQIYQNVNSAPPGWIGTLGLGTVYAVSLLVAVVGGAVFAVGLNSDLGKLAMRAALGPKQKVESAQIVRSPPGAEPADFYAAETLVAQFGDRAAAERSLAELQSELGPQRRMVLFGNTLLLPLDAADTPASRDVWFDRLEAATAASGGTIDDPASTFIDHADRRAMVQLTCIAPDVKAAEQIEEAAAGYTGAGRTLRLVPPWDQRVELTPAQQKARRTARELRQVTWLAGDEGDAEISAQLLDAERRGRNKRVADLQRQLEKRSNDRRTAQVARLRQEGAERYDLQIIEAYEQALAANEEAAADDSPRQQGGHLFGDDWLQGLADRLGKVDEDRPAATALSTDYGSASRNGLFLEFMLSFEAMPCGLLALVDWLESQGCADLRYRIISNLGEP